MEKLKKQLISIWENEVRDGLGSGEITNENQLQAEMFHQLKVKFPKLKIWAAPMLFLKKYDLNKIKPDLIISNDTEVLAVIQMQFKPWAFVDFKNDLRILHNFGTVGKTKNIRLGIKPFSSIWQEQKPKTEYNLNFTLANNFLKVFITCGRIGCHSLNLKNEVKTTTNLLHLFGYVESEENIFFGNRSYNFKG